MNSIKTLAVSAIIFFTCMLGLTLLTSFTAAEPPVKSIYKVTSYDGITVYSYGDYVIVKTDNSVSITR